MANEGFAKFVPQAKRTPMLLRDLYPNLDAETRQFEPFTLALDDLTKCKLIDCKYIIARSGDVCKPGSWVFFERGLRNVSLSSRVIQHCFNKGSMGKFVSLQKLLGVAFAKF